MNAIMNAMRSTDMNKTKLGIMSVEPKRKKIKNQVDGQISLYDTGAPNTIIYSFFSEEPRKVRRNRHIPEGQMLFFDIGVEWGKVISFPEQKSVNSPKPVKEASPAEKLFDENKKLIGYCVKNTAGVFGSNWHDAEQAGLIALWKAAEGFDPSRGVSFSSFATVAIKRAIFREVNNSIDKLNPESLDAFDSDAENFSEELQLPSAEETVISNENNGLVDTMNKFADSLRLIKEKKGVKAYAMHLQGYSGSQIAEALGFRTSSYTALVSVGRKVVQNNPLFARAANEYRETSVKNTKVNLLDSEFELQYSADAIFDVPSQYEGDFEAAFLGLVSQEHVAEYLLFESRIDEPVCIINRDTGCTSQIIMKENAMELTLAVQTGQKLRTKIA